MLTTLFVLVLVGLVAFLAVREIRAERQRLREAGALIGPEQTSPRAATRILGFSVLGLWPLCALVLTVSAMGFGDPELWEAVPSLGRGAYRVFEGLSCVSGFAFYVAPAFAIALLGLGQAPRWIAIGLPLALGVPVAATLLLLVTSAVLVFPTNYQGRATIIQDALSTGSVAVVVLALCIVCLRFSLRYWPARGSDDTAPAAAASTGSEAEG